jgi:hypothetical protein
LNAQDSITSNDVWNHIPALAGVGINIFKVLLSVPWAPCVGEKYNRFGNALTINQVRPHSAHHVWKTQPAAW